MNFRTFPLIISLALVVAVSFVSVRSAEALLDTHECAFCHDFHGAISNSGLLKYSSTEVLCLSCHSTVNGTTDAAAVHNPANLASSQQGYITCRECHNPHDNIDSNVKLVGYKFDPATLQKFTVPKVREELTTSDLASPVYKDVTFVDTTAPDADFYRSDGKGICGACHTSNHLVGAACTDCHNHENDFGGTVDPPEGFPADGDCTTCHTGTGTDASGLYSYDAYLVGSGSPHTITTVGGTFNACTDCHAGHSDTATVIVPNNATVGIDYSANGETGIALGGTETSGSTEAEICWNCHFGEGISEWGVNTDTNGGASNYDFGDIYTTSGTTTKTANWIGAWWKSAVTKFSYKTSQIQSTHAVGNTAILAGVDPVEEIRCSYCHDVHDTAGIAGDVDGKPYLRGSWMGSPYREDGAPQAGDTWSTNGNYGAVPRGGTQAWQQGGYQIDQNNGNPTTGGSAAHTSSVSPAWAVGNSAGLCLLCHGSDVDNLNKFGDPSAAWVGTNGHANAAIGGSGSASGNASDIFSMAIRNPSGAPLYTGRGSHRGYPRQSYGNAGEFSDSVPSGDRSSDTRAYGFRGQDWSSFRLSPRVTEDGWRGDPYAYRAYNWGASVDNTLDDRYHKFSCSKCHNPHASRLPRLLITNCLDTKHNTWDDQASVSTLGTSTDYAPENRGVTFAMATSAQNCHRLADNTFTNATGMGWNQVTPWRDTDGNYGTYGDKNQDNAGIE